MVKAVVGANWGDEGKGKITDVLAKDADVVIRFQGGSNAGHTIINEYGRFALHQLPSGVFYHHTTNIISDSLSRLQHQLKVLIRIAIRRHHHKEGDPRCGEIRHIVRIEVTRLNHIRHAK